MHPHILFRILMSNIPVLQAKLLEVTTDLITNEGLVVEHPEQLRTHPKYIRDEMLSVLLDMYLCEYAFSLSRLTYGQLLTDTLIQRIQNAFGIYSEKGIASLQTPYARVHEHAYKNEYLIGSPVFSAALSNPTTLRLSRAAAIYDIEYVANEGDIQTFVPGADAKQNLYIATAYSRRLGQAPLQLSISELVWKYLKTPNSTMLDFIATKKKWIDLLVDSSVKGHVLALQEENQPMATNCLQTFITFTHPELLKLDNLNPLYELSYSLGFPLERAVSFVASKNLSHIECSTLPSM